MIKVLSKIARYVKGGCPVDYEDDADIANIYRKIRMGDILLKKWNIKFYWSFGPNWIEFHHLLTLLSKCNCSKLRVSCRRGGFHSILIFMMLGVLVYRQYRKSLIVQKIPKFDIIISCLEDLTTFEGLCFGMYHFYGM